MDHVFLMIHLLITFSALYPTATLISATRQLWSMSSMGWRVNQDKAIPSSLSFAFTLSVTKSQVRLSDDSLTILAIHFTVICCDCLGV